MPLYGPAAAVSAGILICLFSPHLNGIDWLHTCMYINGRGGEIVSFIVGTARAVVGFCWITYRRVDILRRTDYQGSKPHAAGCWLISTRTHWWMNLRRSVDQWPVHLDLQHNIRWPLLTLSSNLSLMYHTCHVANWWTWKTHRSRCLMFFTSLAIFNLSDYIDLKAKPNWSFWTAPNWTHEFEVDCWVGS